MKKFGLIGYPLKHSFSKKYFTEKFEKENLSEYQYEHFELQNLSDLPKILHDNPDLCGLNVTIPHKIGVMFFINKIDPVAREIDAVNCIKINHPSALRSLFTGELCTLEKGKYTLEGYNTDIYGFEKSLKPLLKKHHKKALILGNGGAARAVKYVLKKLDIDFHPVTRRSFGNIINYTDLTKEIIESHKLIINTTPVGTFPDVDECPQIPYEHITSNHILYDLIYNPDETLFLKKGKERGATIKNGYEMLTFQAEKAWEIWNEK